MSSASFAHQVWVAEDSDFPDFGCYTTDSLIRYGESNVFSDGRHAGKTFLAVALECADYYVWLSNQPLDTDPPSQFTYSMSWWMVFKDRAILLDMPLVAKAQKSPPPHLSSYPLPRSTLQTSWHRSCIQSRWRLGE